MSFRFSKVSGHLIFFLALVKISMIKFQLVVMELAAKR
jgi:hypothetical protein